jgi:NDP-sugar pyrophosphorylase family protein
MAASREHNSTGAALDRVQAVLLAGGQGVRLRPLTYAIPKPLLAVDEKPILEEIIARLANHGIDQLVLAVGYRAELIEAYFQDGANLGVRIAYVREKDALGTAGPLALVRQAYYLEPDRPVLAMNGDILTDLDFDDLLRAHTASGCEMTVVARTYVSQLPYGVLQIEGGRIRGVVEKPSSTHQVSAGIYALQPSAFDAVPDGKYLDMPDLIERLVAAGRPVGAYCFDGEWLAVEQVEQLQDARRQMIESQP